MRVAEVAKKLEISTDWLRKAEKQGIIPAALRDMNGHRRYTPELVAEIHRIMLKKEIQINEE